MVRNPDTAAADRRVNAERKLTPYCRVGSRVVSSHRRNADAVHRVRAGVNRSMGALQTPDLPLIDARHGRLPAASITSVSATPTGRWRDRERTSHDHHRPPDHRDDPHHAARRGLHVPVVRRQDREAGGCAAGREQRQGAVRLVPHRGGPRPAGDRGGPARHRGRQGRLRLAARRVLSRRFLMIKIRELMHGRWGVPVVSGMLIVASFAVAGASATNMVSDVLMAAAAVVAGVPIVAKAVRALAVKVVGVDLLVSVATVGALVIGENWEAAAVTFLFAVGHALENATLNRTRSASAELIAVAPDIAVVLRGGHQVEVAAASVALEETVLVKNGAKVPVDGEVIGGAGAVDEASITGESLPVEKGPGDRVFAGTVSRGGLLQVRATGVGADTTLARIIHRVEEAQDAKAPTQAFMDRFSAWYTPAIIALALVVGLATGNVVLALTLLVIGCPGALVISIPVAVVAGIGRGAKEGILIKGGQFLETSARITAVALDKTGTLTEGRPVLTDVVVLDPALSRADVLGAAVAAAPSTRWPARSFRPRGRRAWQLPGSRRPPSRCPARGSWPSPTGAGSWSAPWRCWARRGLTTRSTPSA